jgi:t-SNARE complex subunit (syntaxin)
MQQIGVNLAETSRDRDINFQFLMDLEVERDAVEFGGFEEEWLDSDKEEQNIDNLEVNALKSLCGEMMEEVFDESSLSLNSELDDFSRKGKSHAKSCLKKTCKIRRAKFSKNGYK